MRFEFLGTKKEKGGEFAYVLDLETGETLKSPVVKKEPVVRTVREAMHQTGYFEVQPEKKLDFEDTPQSRIRSVLPQVELEPRDDHIVEVDKKVEEVAVEDVNPYARPNPHFAWEDPNWSDPRSPKRREYQKRTYPPMGLGGVKLERVFREPGKFDEKDLDHV